MQFRLQMAISNTAHFNLVPDLKSSGRHLLWAGAIFCLSHHACQDMIHETLEFPLRGVGLGSGSFH